MAVDGISWFNTATRMVSARFALDPLIRTQVAPEESTAVEAVEVADITTVAVQTDPVLITSADHASGAWQASLTQGQPMAGSYEAQPLPNGRVAIKLKSDACQVSSDATLIVSSGDISGIWPASSTEGQSVVGATRLSLYQMARWRLSYRKPIASRN